MEFLPTAVLILLSLILLGSASAQNQGESATDSASRYRLGNTPPYDLDGLKILVLSASTTCSSSKPRNLLWKGLEAEGVDLTFVRDKFHKYKLNSFDQLWMFSSNQYDARILTKRDFQAIIQFAKRGNGLYLLSDAVAPEIAHLAKPPTRNIGAATFEADVIARELFKARVHGCYVGQQVLQFTDPKPKHPLLTSIRTLYEGTTVSHISDSQQLDVIVSASDGSPLIAVSKTQNLNVVLDCGWTRYHARSTDDSVQLAINVARFLTGNEQDSLKPVAPPSP